MLYLKMEKTSLPFQQKFKGTIAQSKIFKHIFSAPLVKQYVFACLSLYVLWQVLTLRLFASGETKMESNAIEVIELKAQPRGYGFDSGQQGKNFDRQDCHTKGVSPMLSPCSILKNLGKTAVLLVLPFTVALELSQKLFFLRVTMNPQQKWKAKISYIFTRMNFYVATICFMPCWQSCFNLLK